MTNKNKGYSLIEMLIVIAIMAILSGLSAVSVSLIAKAKCQDAVQSFDSQLSNLWLQTKSTAGSQQIMYMTLEKSASGSCYQVKIYDGVASTPKETNVLEGNPERSRKCRVKIQYREKESDSFQEITDTNTINIKFDKSTGAVLEGAGEYMFTDTSDKKIASVYLNAMTGNHYYTK
jgi:prepilin-type N-terminal cleavage/methylation domain-containing protein